MANKRSDILPVPTESVEQQCVFHWAAWARGQWPEIRPPLSRSERWIPQSIRGRALPGGGREGWRTGSLPSSFASGLSRAVYRTQT